MSTHDQETKFGLTATVTTTAVGLCSFAIIIGLVATVVILARAGSKLRKELIQKQAKANAVYDEIDMPTPAVCSTRNIAYATVTLDES